MNGGVAAPCAQATKGRSVVEETKNGVLAGRRATKGRFAVWYGRRRRDVGMGQYRAVPSWMGRLEVAYRAGRPLKGGPVVGNQ